MLAQIVILVVALAAVNGFRMPMASVTRLHQQHRSSSTSASSSQHQSLRMAQDFLEVEPYHDTSQLPMNTFKAAAPFIGKIVSVTSLVGPDSPGEAYHVVIDHGGKFKFWEGQSLGVIPPGINPKTNKAYPNRLYSIAATRYGDDMTGTTTTLCVRRAVFVDPETKQEDPSKKGVCSNFLCTAKPGDSVSITGPTGKVMIMPEKNPDTDLIMIATGTGVAPYRGFVRRLFFEDTPAAKAYKGLAWLFLGVANKDALLYNEDWLDVKKRFPNNFRYDVALSREHTNKKGGKMYIQDKVEEYSDEVFERLDKGAHIYFCGLKGMMPGLLESFERVATGKGLVWADKLAEWKDKGQWHVEVY